MFGQRRTSELESGLILPQILNNNNNKYYGNLTLHCMLFLWYQCMLWKGLYKISPTYCKFNHGMCACGSSDAVGVGDNLFVLTVASK